MTYDEARRRTVIFGGMDGIQYLSDTWEYGCVPISMMPLTLPGGTAGASYSQALQVVGGTTSYQFAVTAGALPPGLTLWAGGLVYGIPTAAGTYTFTVTATESLGCSTSLAYTIRVDCPAITISPAILPAGIVGAPYAQTLTAAGGTDPYTFGVVSGTLPPGLTLASSGFLNGTPVAAGVFSFQVEAIDANGCSGNQTYTIQVDCPAITISPAALPAGDVGTPYAQTLTAAGGTAPYSFGLLSGALPPGLALTSSGFLYGTPVAAGTFTFQVEAVDANACSGDQSYTVTVDPLQCGAIVLSPSSLPPGTRGVPYARAISASGGSAPYSFSITAGAPPPGLSLAPDGLLSGTPSLRGSFTFTVTATDAASCSASRSYSLEILEAADVVAGCGLGPPNPNRVRVFTGAGAYTGVDVVAYAAGTWGVNVAAGQIDGAVAERLLTGPGPGPTFGPQVRAFTRDGLPLAKVNFFAFGTLRYGVNVAAVELDGDGYAEIGVGPGPGEVFGPHVRAFDYDGAAVVPISKVSFFAYATLKYGVGVAAGDVDGDAYQELLTGPGPSVVFAPQVRGFDYDGTGVSAIAKINFNAFPVLEYGVIVTGGEVDLDGFEEIAAAPGPGAPLPSRFLGFDYDANAVAALPGFEVTPFQTLFGGRLGTADLEADGRDDLVTAAGRDPAADSTVKGWSYNGAALSALPGPFVPFALQTYGANVAGGLLGW